MDKIKCEVCGLEEKDTTEICSRCGSKFEKKVVEEPEVEPEVEVLRWRNWYKELGRDEEEPVKPELDPALEVLRWKVWYENKGRFIPDGIYSRINAASDEFEKNYKPPDPNHDKRVIRGCLTLLVIWIVSIIVGGAMFPTPNYDATGEWEGTENLIMGLFIIVIPLSIALIWGAINYLRNNISKK